MTTPYDRLMAEGIPTRPRRTPRPEPPPKPLAPWMPEEQDAHWAALCKTVGTPGAKRPHLRAVPEPAETDAA